LSKKVTNRKEDEMSKEEKKGEEPKPTVTVKNESEDKKRYEVKRKRRWILFVGNLHKKVTEDDLRFLFLSKSGEIDEVRFVRDKKTNVFKNCAFVEFKTPKGFKKGKKLHGYDLLGKPMKVEYTAGGGGNTLYRREKIRMKNSGNYKSIFKIRKRLNNEQNRIFWPIENEEDQEQTKVPPKEVEKEAQETTKDMPTNKSSVENKEDQQQTIVPPKKRRASESSVEIKKDQQQTKPLKKRRRSESSVEVNKTNSKQKVDHQKNKK